MTGDDHQTSLTQRLRHEEILDRFETAWRNGPRPSLQTALSEAKVLRSARLAGELLKLDLHYRRLTGESPSKTDYLELFADFPGLVDEEFSEAAPTPGNLENSAVAAETSAEGKRPADSNSASITIGSQFGPYEILAKLGEGGMGTVYKARHRHLDKLVAIKVLPPQFTAVEESITRFKREMKAIGKIDHPHLVRAMDAGEIEGTHYLAMEFVEGTDLAQAVKTQGRFSVAEACRVLHQAAAALSAAHQAGLVHRDVKPSNLLLSKSGEVKLLDLGLARLGEDAAIHTAVTLRGQAFGTPDFMAPEQWEDSHSVDARADLYALGCTLCYMLTGRPPYGDERHRTPLSKMTGHTSHPIPELQAVRPDVPAELAAIYARLMAKDPNDRFQTADQLIEALSPFRSSVTPQASVIVPANAQNEKVPESSRRLASRHLGMLAGVLAATTLVVLVWTMFPPASSQSVTTEGTNSAGAASQSSLNPVSTPNAKPVTEDTEPARSAVSAEEEPEPELTELPDSPAGNMIPGSDYLSSDWEWTEPVSLGEAINQTGHETYPVLMGKERRMYFLREDKFIVASRSNRHAAFSDPRLAVDPFTGSRPSTGPLARMNRQEILSISLTEDGLILVMAVRQASRRRPRGANEDSIWLSRRDRDGEGFGIPVRLPDVVNASHSVLSAWIALDGLSLIVARPGDDSLGAADLYQHTRQSRDEEFGPAVPLGNVVNTSRSEIAGTMSPDHLVLFRTSRVDARDDSDGVETVMCFRSSADQPFESAQPLDPKLQSYHPIAIQCSPDGRRIYFHGSMDRDLKRSSLYMAERALKRPGVGQ